MSTFTPHLEECETRDTPSAVSSYTFPGRPTEVNFIHSELGEFGNEGRLIPFPDYSGPVNTAMHARDRIAVAAGASGAPRVKVFDITAAATTERADFFAYDPSFRGGARVTLGDVTGDGVADVVTGAATGGAPHVKVFDGVTFNEIASFFAYDSSFRGGVWVGFADPDGDGTGVIVTAPGLGGGPHVKTYDLVAGIETNAFYGNPSGRNFTEYVVGDLDGDVLTELAVADTAGLVRVYDFVTGVEVYQTRTFPQARLGVGSYFDYFSSTLLASRGPSDLGFQEFDLALGITSYVSLEFLGVAAQPGLFTYGTQSHPARAAEAVGQEVLDQIERQEVEFTSLPLVGEFGALVEAARDRQRPLVGGISVGGPRGTGTLTIPVRGTDGIFRALSNEHVFAVAPDSGPYYVAGQPVTQPGRVDGGTERVGTTGRNGGLVFGGSPNPIDAALADLAPGVTVNPGVIVYSDFFGGPALSLRLAGVREAAIGQPLYHFGRTSIQARHYLIADDATLPVIYQGGRSAELIGQSLAHGQYGGEAARPGDSGSPVAVYDKFERAWYLTGQLFAGGGTLMIYTPISTVFDRLGVSLY